MSAPKKRRGGKAPKQDGPGPDAQEQGPEPLQLLSAGKLKAEKTDWLWAGRIPLGHVVELSGPKNAGKSTLCSAIAADVTGGPRIHGGKRRALGAVLWIASEEAATSGTRPKLHAAGADLARVHFPAGRSPGEATGRVFFPRDLGAVAATVRAARIKLLVLDPWQSCLEGEGNLNDPAINRGIVEYLGRLAAECGALVLITRNFRKNKTGPALDHALGSSEVTNACRHVLQLRPDPDLPGQHVLVVTASNLGPLPPAVRYAVEMLELGPRISWGKELRGNAEDFAAGLPDAAERDARRDAITLLRKFLYDGWKSSADCIAEARNAGIGERTLRAAKAELGVRSKRVATGGSAHWEWGAPKDGWPPEL